MGSVDPSKRRSVHVSVPKVSYVKLKIATFERQLTIQNTLAGFAAFVAMQDARAMELLDELAMMKLKGTLEDHANNRSMSEFDRDLIYNLIEETSEEEGI